MYEIGQKVLVRNGLNLYDVDSSMEVVVTQEILDCMNKEFMVTNVSDGYYQLSGMETMDGMNLYFAEEWLIPLDGEFKVTCEHCGKEMLYQEAKIIGGKFYCEECAESLPLCDNCGNIIDDDVEPNIYGLKLCKKCIEKNVKVRDYNYTPSYWEHRTVNDDDKSLLIGAEIEIDKGSDSRDTMRGITQIMGNSVVFKHDGSLDSGFEIVTHPFSFDFYHEKFDYIKRMMDVAKENGYKSHETNTCGLHLHVNRHQLPTDERSEDNVIDNILLILETFKSELDNFARRTNSRYARYLQEEASCTSVTMSFVRTQKERQDDKYKALNLRHGSTIEFRIFKGTLRPETFMASIELVNNIVDIARFGEIDGLTWNDVINHNSDKNVYIQEYNASRGIVSDTFVQVLSYVETHKDEFSIDSFIDGNFGLNLDETCSEDLYKLIGILKYKGIVSEDTDMTASGLYDEKVKVKRGKLKTNCRTKLFSGQEVLSMWFD